MKKILSFLLALALVFSLIGCKPADSLEAPIQPTVEVQTTESTQAPTEETTETAAENATEAATDVSAGTTQPSQSSQADQSPTQTEPSVGASTETSAETRSTQPDDRDEQPDDRDEQPDDREVPTTAPTQTPTESPTEAPTEAPTEVPTEAPTEAPTQQEYPIDPNGYYKYRDDVALYIHTFGRLPGNYISKTQGNSQYGSYKNIPSTMNIGGDRFYNNEGLLPSGYTYYECDIGTSGGTNRGSKRIVYTTSGIVYYTSDHYASFTRLY